MLMAHAFTHGTLPAQCQQGVGGGVSTRTAAARRQDGQTTQQPRKHRSPGPSPRTLKPANCISPRCTGSRRQTGCARSCGALVPPAGREAWGRTEVSRSARAPCCQPLRWSIGAGGKRAGESPPDSGTVQRPRIALSSPQLLATARPHLVARKLHMTRVLKGSLSRQVLLQQLLHLQLHMHKERGGEWPGSGRWRRPVVLRGWL